MAHEYAFAAFLLLTWARLAAVEGVLGKHALIFAALLAVCAAITRLGQSRARLVFYAVLVQFLYLWIRSTVDLIHPLRSDALLERADLLLFGFNPNLALDRLAWAPLSDLLSVCYLACFLPYMAWAFVSYYRGEGETFRRYCEGLFVVYALGFLGYSLFPAIAPFAAMADRYGGPLPGGWLTAAHHAFVAWGTNGIDAFPSLHCALTGYVLFFDRRSAPKRFRAMLVPVALMWVSTVYLRYHYVVDVLAGFTASAFGLWVSGAQVPGLRRFSRSRSFCS